MHRQKAPQGMMFFFYQIKHRVFSLGMFTYLLLKKSEITNRIQDNQKKSTLKKLSG
jgi:hypothetical protein